MKSSAISAKRAIKVIATIIIVILFFYLWADRHTPNTRDAYVNAYVVAVSSEVDGRVEKVLVADNQTVKKDQPLFVVDQVPYKLAVELAQTKYNITSQTVSVLQSRSFAL